MWMIIFTRGAGKRFFWIPIFRPDLFEPGSEPWAENAVATGRTLDIVMEVITGTEIHSVIFCQKTFEENIEQEFYYPDLYSLFLSKLIFARVFNNEKNVVLLVFLTLLFG